MIAPFCNEFFLFPIKIYIQGIFFEKKKKLCKKE